MTSTSDTTTGTIERTVDDHLAAYGETDPTRRRALIESAWAPDGVLLDPPLDAAGHDGLDATFAAVQGHYAGHTFRRSTVVDAHHDVARYGWELVGPDGAVALAGLDVAQVGSDGRLVRVAGFFGEPAPIGA